MNYDAIVIGAGNGGLVAALTLQKSGKKVLLLESHNVPGGLATSFVRGRFEFEACLQELTNYGTKDEKGTLQQVFEELGVADKIDFVDIPNVIHIVTLDTEEEYILPTGINNFIEQMEYYVPNSKTSMEQFFALSQEITEAMDYIYTAKDELDMQFLKEKYSNFLVCSSYSVNKVLDTLKMPKKAQEILTSYWFYLGASTNDLSFVHYATFIYSLVVEHPVIASKRSHEISLTLFEEFSNCGGTSKFLATVNKIIVEKNQVTGVITSDNEYFYAPTIIANVSPNTVYGKLIDPKCVPRRARQLVNARIIGGRSVTLYLGLNKSPNDLGLKEYSYFIYHTLDNKKEYERMKQLKGDNMVGIVLNNAISDASPKGTTILYLTTTIFSDNFDLIVNKNNYFDLKDAFIENMIEVFEEATKINIKDSIEELELATPETFARYTSNPAGSFYGYLNKKCDNLLPRLLNAENENYISGLYFVGGYAHRSIGPSASYMSGYDIAKKILKEEKKEEVNNETKN